MSSGIISLTRRIQHDRQMCIEAWCEVNLALFLHGNFVKKVSIFSETPQAYCNSDHFTARCKASEVILIEQALYGRMRMSRCVRENFGYIGCARDVTTIVDGICSGRRSCTLKVLDETFLPTEPCHNDLKSYLEVKHRCITGEQGIREGEQTK